MRDPAPLPTQPGTHLAQARPVARWALTLLGAGQIAIALALLVHALANLDRFGDSAQWGRHTFALLFALAIALLLAALGARAIQAGLALARPDALPTPGRAILRAAQAAAALATVLGLHHIATGDAVGLGLMELAAGLFALLAAGAWTSQAAGAAARASLWAAVAGVLWLGASLAAGRFALLPMGPQPELAAALHAVLPPGAAVLVASLALLAFAILQRTANRGLGPAGGALAALLGAIQVLVLSLDAAGMRPWELDRGAAAGLVGLLVTLGLAAAVAAGVAGMLAAGLALAHHAPPLVAKAGAGFMAPTPGSACASCGHVPPFSARFCPECGAARGSL